MGKMFRYKFKVSDKYSWTTLFGVVFSLLLTLKFQCKIHYDICRTNKWNSWKQKFYEKYFAEM